ncbi:MAG: protein-glutamate O-methyltransferase CheR [Desulfotomaculaceae bacterium]|nr:protein-glutamate O-methyltransferase CheR [Desulfotomaculaceae bacterium]
MQDIKETKEHNYDERLEKIEINLLLEGIYQHYGYDFRNYVYPTIRRRTWQRIRAENLSTISGLLERILHNKRVMKLLMQDYCISVTEMFRDAGFFLAIRKKLLPLLKNRAALRIWHAGCATGEEVFSMAILLFEEGLLEKTFIYATDINEDMLQKAKLGIFPLAKMQVFTSNYIKAGGVRAFSDYYKVSGKNAVFEPFLIKNALFSQHNLATDHSFHEFDVIICRNVLIYFNQYLQRQVLKLFHESLSIHGVLCLGNKETIHSTDLASCYDELDKKEKLYRRII